VSGAGLAGEPFTHGGLSNLIPSGFGAFDVACPACGPERRSPLNKRRKVLRIWRKREGRLTFLCQRCTAVGAVSAEGQAAASEPKLPAAAAAAPSDAERTAGAVRLWRAAVPPGGTLVERYLANRGLVLPPEAAGEAIRFHPRCPFGKGIVTPAMVALVRDIRTDEPIGIHRTALTHDGHKAVHGGNSRLSLGPIGGGAVKLTPNADVGLGLGVGEGLESSLSLRNIPGCENLAAWAVLSANQLAAFPVLPGLEGLWIAVDHDLAGMAAAETVRTRWQEAGVDVVTARPRVPGLDLNDVRRRANA